jgi:hypothetical protein
MRLSRVLSDCSGSETRHAREQRRLIVLIPRLSSFNTRFSTRHAHYIHMDRIVELERSMLSCMRLSLLPDARYDV